MIIETVKPDTSISSISLIVRLYNVWAMSQALYMDESTQENWVALNLSHTRLMGALERACWTEDTLDWALAQVEEV